MKNKIIEQFKQAFNYAPKYLVQAPGRVNIIGEHTDYNDGFVLPMAIDRYVYLALSPRNDHQVHIHSMDFNETAQFSLDKLNINNKETKHWIEYIKGVAYFLQKHGNKLNGFDGILHGNIPRGAGLSSSAAVELTAAKAFATISDINWDGIKMAKLAQQAENQWIGVNCGIMDQMAISLGKARHALLIDCRSLETKSVPLPPEVSVVIMDTSTRRGLVDSAYNERRSQCELAAKTLGVEALRDVTDDLWQKAQSVLRDNTLLRARHVVTENQRVLQAVDAMQKMDPVKLGELMNASHESLRFDFEVSSKHLDTMVECARNAVGCYGARMTGAGFGGCAVALVKEIYAEDFVYQVAEQYEHATKLKPSLYVTQAMNGVAIVTN